jgi:hypothetical protein
MFIHFTITEHNKLLIVKIMDYSLVICSSSKDSVCKRKQEKNYFRSYAFLCGALTRPLLAG